MQLHVKAARQKGPLSGRLSRVNADAGSFGRDDSQLCGERVRDRAAKGRSYEQVGTAAREDWVIWKAVSKRICEDICLQLHVKAARQKDRYPGGRPG